jgi:hypothetical protein
MPQVADGASRGSTPAGWKPGLHEFGIQRPEVGATRVRHLGLADSPGAPKTPGASMSAGAGQYFEIEEAWRAAIRPPDIRPALGLHRLDSITAFDCDKRCVIGHSKGGFFLPDKDEDTLDTWPTEDSWAQAVRKRTSLDSSRLRDPKAWTVQCRPAGY